MKSMDEWYDGKTECSLRIVPRGCGNSYYIGIWQHKPKEEYFDGGDYSVEQVKEIISYLQELITEPTYNISEYIGSVGAYNILDDKGEVLKLTKSQWKERLGF